MADINDLIRGLQDFRNRELSQISETEAEVQRLQKKDMFGEASPDPMPYIRNNIDVAPDQAVKDNQVANDLAIPVDAVRADSRAASQQQRINSIDELLRDRPVTSGWLSNESTSAMAHDSVEQLTLLEETANAFRAFATAIPETASMAVSGIGRLGQALRRNTYAPLVDTLRATDSPFLQAFGNEVEKLFWRGLPVIDMQGRNLFDNLRDVGQAGLDAIEPFKLEEDEQSFVTDVAGGLGQLSAQAAMLIITGGLAGTAMMAGQGAEIQGSRAEQLGATQGEQDLATALGAAVTAATERVGLDLILNRIPTAYRNKVVQMIASGGSEAVQEITEGILQNLVTWSVYSPDFEVFNFEELAYEGGVAGTVGALFSLVVPGRKVSHQKEVMDEMAAQVQESPLTTRDPVAAKEHLKTVMEATADIRQVYIPIETIDSLLETHTADRQEFLNLIEVKPEAIAEARDLQNDVTVPVGGLASLMISEDWQTVSPSVRYDVDGLTAEEAAELADTGVAEILALTDPLEARTEDVEGDLVQEAAELVRPSSEPPSPQELDGQVEIAATEMGLQGMFDSAAEAGMTDGEYKSYLEATQRAADKSKKRAEQRVLRDEKRKATAEWARVRENVEAVTAERVAAEPVYNSFLGIGRERLDRDAVVEAIGAEQLDSLPKQPGGRNIYTAPGEAGLDLDGYAQVYQFQDGQVMLFNMMDRRPYDEEVQVMTDREMDVAFGYMKNDIQRINEALEDVHNDDVASVLMSEMKALSKAKVAKRVSLRALKLAASQRIQEYQVGQISPNKFMTASKRHARLAKKELRKGNRQLAADHKFRQLLNFEMSQQAYGVKNKVDAQRRWMRRFNNQRKRFNIPPDYLSSIRDLLQSYNLSPKLTDQTRKKLMDWAKRKAAETGSPVAIPDRILVQDSVQHYSDMSLHDWNTLHQTVRQWHHMGVKENKFSRATEKRRVSEEAAVMSQLVTENLNRTQKTIEDRGRWDSTKRYGREALTLLFNADTMLRQIDGWKDLGPAYRMIKGRYDQAYSEGYTPDQVGYIQRAKNEAKSILKLYKKFTNKEQNKFYTKNIEVPGVPFKVSHEQIISVLLNLGNVENRRALTESGQFTDEQLNAIRDYASAKDWNFVQSVWDYFEGFWPEIVSATERRQGYTPEKVVATPIDTPHGTFRGGYYPLRYDNHQSIVEADADTGKMLRDARYGNYIASHTRRGHTEARVGSGGRKVLLDLFVMNSHVDQVIYDLEMGDALTDIYKVMHNKDVKQAFGDSGYAHYWEALEMWLGDVITGEMRMGGILEASLRWMRTGFTISKLGWNVGVTLLQPLGLFQTMAQLGKWNTVRGVYSMLSEPQIGKNSIYNYVSEQSGFMRSREESFNKDIIDANRQLRRGLLSKVAPNTTEFIGWTFFIGIRKTQKIVDTATWIAAQRAGMEKFDGDFQKSKDFADRTVARAQASGVFGERTPFERGTINSKLRQSETVRAWSALISYFMAKANVTYERTKKTNFKNPFEVINWATDMALLYTVEAMLATLIREGFPDDEEEWWLAKWAGEETVKTMFSGLPVVREFTGNLFGFRGVGVPGAVGEEFYKLGQGLSEGEIDESLLRTINNLLGIFLKYPASQINKTAAAVNRQDQGYDVEPIEYLMGPTWEG